MDDLEREDVALWPTLLRLRLMVVGGRSPPVRLTWEQTIELTGLHHVSGMTADAPGNLRFYTQMLGLRLVKKTVNQDDTRSYHLFYGDAVGGAGTEVTFFDLPNLGRNRPGIGTISNVALRVEGVGALEWWREHLTSRGLYPAQVLERAGRESFTFEDHEGQSLQLVVDGGAPGAQPVRSGSRAPERL